MEGHPSNDIPDFFGGVAEFTACDARTQIEITDADAVVLDFVGEVISAFGHGADENTAALIATQTCDIVVDTDNRCIS